MTPARRQALRFACAGLAGLAVDTAVLYLGLALGAGRYGARALSFLAAAFCTWRLNRRYTFVACAGLTPWREWWAYLAAMLGGGAVNYGVYALFLQAAPAHPLAPMAAVCAGSLVGMTVNFANAKFLVFRG